MKNAPHFIVVPVLLALVAGCATGPASYPRRAVNRIPQQTPAPVVPAQTALERRDSVYIWPGAPARYNRGAGAAQPDDTAASAMQDEAARVHAFDQSEKEQAGEATAPNVPPLPQPKATAGDNEPPGIVPADSVWPNI